LEVVVSYRVSVACIHSSLKFGRYIIIRCQSITSAFPESRLPGGARPHHIVRRSWIRTLHL